MDFDFIIDYKRAIIALLFFLNTYLLALFMKKDVIWLAWHCLYILIFLPTCIYYSFNPNVPISLLISKTLFFVILIPFANINIRTSRFKFRIKDNNKMAPLYIVLFSFILFIPFFKFIPYIDISNIILNNIYDTRFMFRSLDASLFTRYLFMPLARVLLPVAIIVGLKNKNRLVIIIATILIVCLYLYGALKSIILGLFLVFIFYNHSYEKNLKIFFSLTLCMNILAIIETIFIKSYFITDYLVRRIFFIPPRLETYYVNYFDSNRYTYWTHNKFGQLFADNTIGEELSFFVGSKLVGIDGLNANIGFIIEGFVSFGYFGVVVHSVIIAVTLLILQSFKISTQFIGLFMIVVYLINTSFLTTLFASHGLAFLLVFSYFFLSHTRDDSKMILANNNIYR